MNIDNSNKIEQNYNKNELPHLTPDERKILVLSKGIFNDLLEGREINQADSRIKLLKSYHLSHNNLEKLFHFLDTNKKLSSYSNLINFIESDKIESIKIKHFDPLQLNKINHLPSVGSKEVRQVAVLPQNEDGTDFGLQNCGFHAVKNALIMQYGTDKNIEKLLLNKTLFSIFYKKYCEPFVHNKPKSQKDASPPIVREIIELFTKDPSPPFQLKEIQTSLRESQQIPIAVFNLTTSDGTPLGNPMLGLMDESGIKDAQKLFAFAKAPGPISFTTIFGNQSSGHWYTMTFYKDKNGEITSFGSDSMDNDHKITGQFSPLYKMHEYMLQQIKNPDEFLQTALKDSFEDILSRESGWIDDPKRKNLLLDSTPNAFLQKEGITDGSPKQIKINRVLLLVDIMKEADWINSPDFEMQNLLNYAASLLQFYVENLEAADPFLSKVKDAQKLLMERPKNLMEDMFLEGMKTIKEQSRNLQLSEVEETRTIQMFDWMKRIYENKDKIAEGETDAQRNQIINSLVENSMGAEGGFSEGTTPKEVDKNMTEKSNLLIKTYQKAKKLGKLREFCKRIAAGDPCLTARMDRLHQLSLEFTGFSIEEENRAESDFVKYPVFILTKIIDTMDFPEDEEQRIRDLKIADLDRERLIETFERYENSEIFKQFREFLKREKLIEEELNWRELLPKLFLHPSFERIFNLAKNDAIASR